MAEVIAKEKLKKLNKKIEIYSRGILVSIPAKANNKAIEIARKNQLSLEKHISKIFNISEVKDNTLILTMTNRHKDMLIKNYPDIDGIVFTVFEFIGKKGSIEDPFGMDIEAYEKCYLQLEQIIEEIIKKIK